MTSNTRRKVKDIKQLISAAFNRSWPQHRFRPQFNTGCWPSGFHIYLPFTTGTMFQWHMGERAFENIVRHGENASNQRSLSYQYCFLLFPKKNQTFILPIFQKWFNFRMVNHSVFKRLVSLGRQKLSLCGNGLKPPATLFQLCHGGQCTYLSIPTRPFYQYYAQYPLQVTVCFPH